MKSPKPRIDKGSIALNGYINKAYRSTKNWENTIINKEIPEII